MLDWFYSFSNAQVGATVVASGLSVTTFIPYVVRRYFNVHPSENVAKGADESVKIAISITILLLAFCLVRMQGDHRSTEDLVTREATVMLKLDRAYRTYGGEAATAMHQDLVQYANLVVNDEWKLLSKGESSEAAQVVLDALGRDSKKLDPQTPAQLVARSEIIQSFNQLSDLHDARVNAGRLKLPNLYWYAIACALVVFTVSSWFISPPSKLLIYVGVVTCGLSLLLSMLIATSGIFVGESAVTAEPLIKAIQSLGKNWPK